MARPYAALYVALLGMGFSRTDLDAMGLPMANALIEARNEMNGATSQREKWATQEDIDALA